MLLFVESVEIVSVYVCLCAYRPKKCIVFNLNIFPISLLWFLLCYRILVKKSDCFIKCYTSQLPFGLTLKQNFLSNILFWCFFRRCRCAWVHVVCHVYSLKVEKRSFSIFLYYYWENMIIKFREMEGNDDKIIKKRYDSVISFLSKEERRRTKKERSFENLLLLLSLVRFLEWKTLHRTDKTS